MQHSASHIEDLLTQLQRGSDLHTEGPGALKALLDNAAQACADHEAEYGSPPEETFALALAVRDIATLDTTGTTLGHCITFWFSMPIACWNHAIHQLNGNSLAFNICEPLLNALPLGTKLLLIHETLRTGLTSEYPLSKWCTNFLSQNANWPFEELLKFLEKLYRAKRVLNLQMAERFNQLKLGQRCLALADAPPKPEMARKAAMALCVLELAPSASTLASQLISDEIEHIGRLLQALRSNPPLTVQPELTKALIQLAQHRLPLVRKDALLTMVVLNVPNLTTIFFVVLRKFTQERNYFYPALLYLNPAQFTELLGLMPPKLKQDALAYLLNLLMTGASDLTSHSMTSARDLLKTLPQEAAASIKEFVLTSHKKRFINPCPSATRVKRAPAKQGKSEETSLFGRKKSNPESQFASAISAFGRIADLDLKAAGLNGHTITGRELCDIDFSRATLENMTFTNCTFKQVLFSDAVLNNVQFQNCKLEKSNAVNAMFDSCTFSDCTISRFNATAADFDKTTFTGCSIHRALFSSAHLHSSVLQELKIEESTFCKASFTRMQIRATHFQLADFTQASFFGCTLSGCTFAETTFNHSSFERSKTEHTFATAGNFNQCIFRQTISDEHHLLMSAEHQRFKELMDLAITIPPSGVPKWCYSVQPLAEHVLNQILCFRNVIRCRYRFLRQNSQRIALTRKTLDEQRMAFFTLLPLLIQTRLFEKQFAPGVKWPVCSISGYAPTYETLQIARSIFDKNPEEEMEPQSMTVDAIYTIGSVGSIAMTGDSDIDYWLSLSPDTFSAKEAKGLSAKLERISEWAQEQFGLETTFFVMNRDAIINNDFGMSDKESSGTAQALLLKEEFYRTALKVCGRDLTWWAMPDNLDRTEHDAVLDKFATLPFNLGESMVNFGIVQAIPAEEYFGAALWQIVKAFKNPFKSVMKLGILDAYLSAPDHDLLCETIKQHIIRGSRSLLKTDPYVTLMRMLQEHYHASGNKDAASLLQTAFLAKLHDAPAKAQEISLLHTMRMQAIHELYGAGVLLTNQDFTQAKTLGDKLNTFFLRTYSSLQQKLEAQQITARITPEDITRLGRKIFTAFAPQQDKIIRLPFVSSMGRTIRELMFKKDTTPGKRKKWIAMGLPKGIASRREAFVELKTESDPARLMMWLVANGIYYPDMHVEVDMTMSPVAAQDVSGLLQGLYDFFPKKMLETDTEETLKNEKILKAYCVLNFILPRDTGVQKQVSVAYVTNWGELFCSALDVDDPVMLTKSPRSYLDKKLSRRVTMDTEIGYLIPYKSRTPRLSIV